MPTTTQLAKKVLVRAKVLDPSENQTAADNAHVVEVMQSVYDSMKERGRIHWTLADIPSMYQDAFVTIVAFRIANDFGVMTAELAQMAQMAALEIDALNERSVDGRETPAVDF